MILSRFEFSDKSECEVFLEFILAVTGDAAYLQSLFTGHKLNCSKLIIIVGNPNTKSYVLLENTSEFKTLGLEFLTAAMADVF